MFFLFFLFSSGFLNLLVTGERVQPSADGSNFPRNVDEASKSQEVDPGAPHDSDHGVRGRWGENRVRTVSKSWKLTSLALSPAILSDTVRNSFNSLHTSLPRFIGTQLLVQIGFSRIHIMRQQVNKEVLDLYEN